MLEGIYLKAPCVTFYDLKGHASFYEEKSHHKIFILFRRPSHASVSTWSAWSSANPSRLVYIASTLC